MIIKNLNPHFRFIVNFNISSNESLFFIDQQFNW